MVYRGSRLPDLVGAYVYGDWSTGRVWGIKVVDDQVIWHRLLVDTPFNITGFGTDHANELYLIDENSGFYRFEPTTTADQPTTPFPTRLSQTGIFATTTDLKLNPAAIPYEVITPHWTDGATSAHAIAMPGLLRIEQHAQPNAGGPWTFPNGTVLAQTLSLNLRDSTGGSSPKRVETRVLTRRQGEWVGYSYKWNDEQTDADLVGDSGDSAEFAVAGPDAPAGERDQVWRFPSRSECLACHARAVGFVLGFSPPQLDTQLTRFADLGFFEGPLPDRAESPRLVNPSDKTASLEARARSYLAVNCATCHVKEGGGNALMELGLETPTKKMHLIDAQPVHSHLGIVDARLVAPGGARAIGSLPPDLAPRRRPNATAGLDRGRPPGFGPDRPVDSGACPSPIAERGEVRFLGLAQRAVLGTPQALSRRDPGESNGPERWLSPGCANGFWRLDRKRGTGTLVPRLSQSPFAHVPGQCRNPLAHPLTLGRHPKIEKKVAPGCRGRPK